MAKLDWAQIHREAEMQKARGGTEGEHGALVLRLLNRIYDLERELQEARQLTLFGDVKPPPKTPIGV